MQITQMSQALQTLSHAPAPVVQNYADAEKPTGTKDGANLTFQLVNTPPPSTGLRLFKNGLLLQRDSDYTVSGNTVTFKGAAATPTAVDTLVAFYHW